VLITGPTGRGKSYGFIQPILRGHIDRPETGVLYMDGKGDRLDQGPDAVHFDHVFCPEAPARSARWNPLAGPDPNRLRTMAQWLTERIGNAATWPRDPDQAVAAIDAILERNLIDPPEQRKRIAVVLDYAQYLVPDGEAGSRSAASRLVRVLGWATNPLLRRVNVAVVLLEWPWHVWSDAAVSAMSEEFARTELEYEARHVPLRARR
jgi:hypothetical protein